MRTKADVLRSMQKYVSQVLAPNPVLASLKAGTQTWTTAGRVKDATNVPLPVFNWLRSRDRHLPVEVGDASAPQSYYLRSDLVESLVAVQAAAAAAGIDLTGPAVADFDLPIQPQWEVRLWYDRGEVPEDRPYARVHFVAGGATTGPALYFETSQPMMIDCYPVPAETAKASTLQAAAVEDALTQGFRGAGIQLGRPLRVPLWDFDGVAEDETTAERNPSDYMKVLDFATRQLPDVEDPRRVRVVADVRVSWRRDVDLTTLKRRDGQPTKGSRIVSSVGVEITE